MGIRYGVWVPIYGGRWGWYEGGSLQGFGGLFCPLPSTPPFSHPPGLVTCRPHLAWRCPPPTQGVGLGQSRG